MNEQEKIKVLFEASGSLKLLIVRFHNVIESLDHAYIGQRSGDYETLKKLEAIRQEAFQQFRIQADDIDRVLKKLYDLGIQSASITTFYEKMMVIFHELEHQEYVPSFVGKVSDGIVNQINYMINDFDKRRKLYYENVA